MAQFGGRARQVEREEQEQEQEVEEAIDFEEAERDLEEESFEIVLEIDKLDEEWHEIADELGTYAGLSLYCSDKKYKSQVNSVLDHVHHYDTLLYQILLVKAELEGATHTLNKTIKEIEKIETKYKPKYFHSKLQDDCKGRRYIERNKKKLQSDVQMQSYDGQALIIDNDIHTYIRHITRLVDLVDKHAHHVLD